MSKLQMLHTGLNITVLWVAGASALYGNIGVGVAGICLYLLGNLSLKENNEQTSS